MKSLFYVLVVGIVVAALSVEAAEKLEGTTTCITGPFTIEPRQCHCASDYMHFTCPETKDGANDRIDGITRCMIGPFMMERRECNCASDGIHFLCPETP